ncbi:MAG TPA: primosomal protein N' [Candidatus Saccharibacteria bacterium]|nr:primosomal protein N' [Candidatus Saccharibacteria bacterium]
MYYYEVTLGVARHWKQPVYAYSSNEEIGISALVYVPFGPQRMLGVVVKRTKKPAFETKHILAISGINISESTLKFLFWYEAYYALAPSQSTAQLLPDYLTKKPQTTSFSGQWSPEIPLPITDAQSEAISAITSTSKPTVLHGITGSGKTRIYLHLIRSQLEMGKNALLLVPEIALTAQLIIELQKLAPTLVFHSQLTDAERSKLWYTIATSENPCVVVGPRSTLFLPYKHLGIIGVDEAHEPSYKQDNEPRYHGLYVAAGLANAHKAKLLLGSATPPICETEFILSRGGNLVCLHEQALKATAQKNMKIVDMRDTTQLSAHPLFSKVLLEAIRTALKEGSQSLLFINRRGTSKLVLCSEDSCDWIATCESCELPLTYHHDSGMLVCHTCGRKQRIPVSCPLSAHPVELRSLGSKAIVEEIQALFPNARIGRFDSDTDTKASFHTQYKDIVEGSVDILIGTQQIIKGLDLPQLSVMGVLNADLSLHFPDYSSEERTFQLIAQALGRVGRGHRKGTVILQTFQPHNPTIQEASREDWHAFFNRQKKELKAHNLPPYRFIAKVIIRDKNLLKAFKRAQSYKESLGKNAHLEVEGPVPSFYQKRGAYYYVQLHLKSGSRNALLVALRNSPEGVMLDLDPTTLL